MSAEPFTLEIGGATLSGLEQGEGLAVVFLHAGVCDKRMWLDQMAVVAEQGWHAVAYDRRGYGETNSEDEPFSHLEDLEALLDEMDIHAAILVGCSMGGGLAVDFALAHAGRVIGLVLVGTSVTGAPWSVTDEESAIEMAEEDAWERGDIDLINRVQAHEWLDGPRSQSGRVGDAARELFLELTREELLPDAWSRIETVSAPTLLIVGDEDFTALVDRHETLSETMPNAIGVVLEGAAHIPSIEKPEVFNSVLLQFLDAISGEESDAGTDD